MFHHEKHPRLDCSFGDVVCISSASAYRGFEKKFLYKKEMQKASLSTQISLPTLALSKSGFGSKRYSFLSADYNQLPICFYFTQKLRYIQDILYFRCLVHREISFLLYNADGKSGKSYGWLLIIRCTSLSDVSLYSLLTVLPF